MIEHIIKRTLEALMMPPGINILLILLGLFIMRRFYRTGKTTVVFGFISLIALSLPIVKLGLFNVLEIYPPLTKAQLARPSAQAIVILGGGMSPRTPEYQYQDSITGYALERVRYGAYLHRQTRLPVLVTGGQVFHDYTPEGVLMQKTLLQEFNTPTRWVESKSKNTMENAIFSQSILNRDKVKRIYLVTHAWHMPRSVAAFRQAGMEVIPAPMGFESKSTDIKFGDFLPNAHSMAKINLWAHEVLGAIWYKFRY